MGEREEKREREKERDLTQPALRAKKAPRKKRVRDFRSGVTGWKVSVDHALGLLSENTKSTRSLSRSGGLATTAPHAHGQNNNKNPMGLSARMAYL
jgi:hypothetical protein